MGCLVELLFIIVPLAFYGLYKGIKWLIRQFGRWKDKREENRRNKKRQKIEEQEEFISDLQNKYPYACSSILKEIPSYDTHRRYKELQKHTSNDLIKQELDTRISKRIGCNDSFLVPLTPYGIQIYTGENDGSYPKQFRRMCNDYFTNFYLANDYCIRNVYKTCDYLTPKERDNIQELKPGIPYNINNQYNGNFDLLSAESKSYLLNNMTAILDAYELYKRYATARKKLLLMQRSCPCAFNYICMRETGKSLNYYRPGAQIYSLDDFTSDEVSKIVKQFDACKELEAEWNRIDYQAAISEGKDLLSKGILLERELSSDTAHEAMETKWIWL